MASTLQTAATAVGLFAGTNVDDLVVLSVLNISHAAEGRPRRWQIWAGQYLGMAVLVSISLAASRGLTLIHAEWVGLLGLIPLSLGLYRLALAVRARRSNDQVPMVGATGLAGIVGITVANGGDNVLAYTPVFAAQSTAALVVTLVVFATAVALWCSAGALLVSHRRVVDIIKEWGHWLVPLVYIVIGLWLLI
ncbi:MAG: cadmium resistance transporter [Mycobacterium sp.]|nr:cadmium resistance transporter [Mycobacterium sp.]